MSRPCPLTAVESDADEQHQESLLKIFLTTAQHFCLCPRPVAGMGWCVGGFTDLFAPVTDPRQPELITYPLAALLFAGPVGHPNSLHQ